MTKNLAKPCNLIFYLKNPKVYLWKKFLSLFLQAEEGTSRRNSETEDNDGSEVNAGSSRVLSAATSREDDEDSSNNASSESKSPGQRSVSFVL